MIECGAHEDEAVADVELGVSLDSIGTVFVETGGVYVDLDFVHHVYVCFPAEFCAGQFVKRFVDIVSFVFIEYCYLAVYVAESQQLFYFDVVAAFAEDIFCDGKMELCRFDDAEGVIYNRCLYLAVVCLFVAGLEWKVVDVWYAILCYADFFHGELQEVADAASECALKEKSIFGVLQACGDFGVHDGLKFVCQQEYRIIVFAPQDNFSPFGTESAEWVPGYLVFVLQLVEEGLEELHVGGYGVQTTSFFGNAVEVEF